MDPGRDLARLQDHLAGCALCQEVLFQMHPRCPAQLAVSCDPSTLTNSQHAQIQQAYRLLVEALNVLDGQDGHALFDNLQFVIDRAKKAASHVLKLGFLTD